MKNTVALLYVLLYGSSVCAGNGIIPKAPSVGAIAYLLQDIDSGRIIVAKNIDQKMPPASLTKMLTAYVAAKELASGRIALDNEVLVSEKAWKTGGSRMFIEVNTKVSVHDLLHGIIIQSGNDASVALAEFISGSEADFAALMNQYAGELGMKNSHFINSTGLSDEAHYTTALDMTILATAMIKETPEIYALHSVKTFTYNGITQHNRNKLLWRDAHVDGIKTGHTETAGFCLVASAKKENMRLISVVMGAPNETQRIAASQALLNYGFRFFDTQKLFSANEKITSVQIWKGQTEELALGVEKDLYVTFPRGQRNRMESRFYPMEHYIAPIEKHSIQGNMEIMLAFNSLAEVNLIALHAVEQGSFFIRLKDSLELLFR